MYMCVRVYKHTLSLCHPPQLAHTHICRPQGRRVTYKLNPPCVSSLFSLPPSLPLTQMHTEY